jgi:hypothetical protein
MAAAHKPDEVTDLLIETINKNNYGWKADVCMLQRNHPSYGDHCDDTSLLQQKDEDTLVEFGKTAGFDKALEKAQKYQKAYKSSSEIPDEELPADFDLRNIEGTNFMGDFVNQGACGSCYTMSIV